MAPGPRTSAHDAPARGRVAEGAARRYTPLLPLPRLRGRCTPRGEVAEWLNAAVSKTV